MFGRDLCKVFYSFPLVLVVLVGFCVAALDLYTKHLCGLLVEGLSEVQLLPFLNFVSVWNTGISFGFFGGHNFSNLFFLFFNIPVIAVILVFSFHEKKISLCVGWGLILGGAVGNMVDRIFFGAVRDFIDFHFLGFHWPAFNIADSAIFLGVVFMLCCLIRKENFSLGERL